MFSNFSTFQAVIFLIGPCSYTQTVSTPAKERGQIIIISKILRKNMASGTNKEITGGVRHTKTSNRLKKESKMVL